MPEYRLTPDAEDDLLQIAAYTIETWGPGQADRYEAALVQCFGAICRGDAHSRLPIPRRPEIRVTRCRHHYVFSFHADDAPPLIIAVLHENMDLVTRLRKRLDGV